MEAELERAIAVPETQELGCHRYAGTDPAILDRILSTCCDYPAQPPSALHDESTTDSVAPRLLCLTITPGCSPDRGELSSGAARLALRSRLYNQPLGLRL